jgi:hypothetical protein
MLSDPARLSGGRAVVAIVIDELGENHARERLDAQQRALLVLERPALLNDDEPSAPGITVVDLDARNRLDVSDGRCEIVRPDDDEQSGVMHRPSPI